MELSARLLAGEPPVDFDTVPVDLAAPGPRFQFQDGQAWDSAPSQTLPGEQADLDLCMVQPASVRRSVVNREAVPEIAALLLPEVIGESLTAMNIQVVWRNRVRSWFCRDERPSFPKDHPADPIHAMDFGAFFRDPKSSRIACWHWILGVFSANSRGQRK
jgi:hypothetical protein